MDINPVFAERTVAVHNFVNVVPEKEVHKKDYVLYFGRYSVGKEIDTLIQACGIPELIRPGETGKLFESGNGSDLKKISPCQPYKHII